MATSTTPTMEKKSSSNGRTNGRESSDLEIRLDVEPRKPRLAWQGMERREAAVSVPTQVVEIVRPGKAQAAEDLLPGVTAGQQKVRRDELPPNRLIWTSDNLVALQTLLDERDPATRDYLYKGKVDLIYIDPPFMVQNDFRADNAIEIELDEDEHVDAKKEPSLVEILAYRDTWRQGLDSFLSMLRARLLLLKDLLAPTGSIYVHLDWHAVHYVKVMMDELFGYENFLNEIIWKRTNARSTSGSWPRVHDTLLAYSCGQPFLSAETVEGDPDKMPHTLITWKDGKKYQTFELTAPGVTRDGDSGQPWRGFDPGKEFGRHWGNALAERERWDRAGLIHWPANGGWPRRRASEPFDPGSRRVAVGDVWTDIDRLNQADANRYGYPTQKPLDLLRRVILASCPPGGTVLDCFLGSGTTVEAAERAERKWIGIDNGKYAVHLARKRLIQLHGQARREGQPQYEYIKCQTCKQTGRKERSVKAQGAFNVRAFTVENIGVYQRAETWQDFQTQRTKYRDEMIKVFGGEPVNHSPLLHGRKGNSWVHVGPLDGPVSATQVWSIAREAQRSERKSVTVLSADFDTLSASEKDEIKATTGVTVTIRIIPASAIDEVRRRLELLRANPEVPIESMAIPAFYAPLSILLASNVSGRMASVTLDRCEIDIESFLASQRPVLKPLSDTKTPTSKKKLKAEYEKWEARQLELEKWLAKANTWQKFIDFWAVDWDYGPRVGTDGKPIFETDWQSFRIRKAKGEVEPLVLTAEYKYDQPGHYRVAARVTDVFGNDGIATVVIEVR